MNNNRVILNFTIFTVSIFACCKGVYRTVMLTEDNVFTHCPVCGKEHQLNDFIDLVRSGEFDLYGTAIYCERCAKKRMEKGASEE